MLKDHWCGGRPTKTSSIVPDVIDNSGITHRAEVGVLSDVAGHGLVAGRGRHDQQQGVSGLLSNGSIPVDERHKEGEDEEVGGALLGWTTKFWVSAGSQQPQQGVENGCVLQQRLLGLADEHLEQLEQCPLAVRVQAAAEVPLNQALQDILSDDHLQYGAHGRHRGAT
ncbi:hypothetical protein INR49_010173, partial [Caranx melampygus]